MSCLQLLQTNLSLLLKYHDLQSYSLLAQKTGVNPNTLRTWMAGKKYPRLASLDSFCDALGFSTCQLFSNSPSFANTGAQNSSNSTAVKNIVFHLNEKYVLKQSDALALFRHEITDHQYISYFRKRNNRNIPLQKLEIMARHMGLTVYDLLL